MILSTTFSKLQNSPLLVTYAFNSFWSILGSLVSKGTNFFCIALIAKILGPEIFGEYNVVQTTTGMFGTIAGLGLGMAATKLIAEWKMKDGKIVGEFIGSLYSLSLITSIVVTMLFFSLSSEIASSLQNNEKLILLFQITSFIVIFDSLSGIQYGILAGFESFKLLSIINIIQGILTMPLLLLGAYQYSIIGLTSMLLITKVLTVIIYEYFLRLQFKKRRIKINLKVNKGSISEICKIGIPSFLGGLSQTPVSWYSNYLLVNQPWGYKNLGVYNAANQLRTFVLFLPDSAGRISIPMLSTSFGIGDAVKFKKTAIITIIWNLLLSVLPAIVLVVFAPLFKELLGSQYNFGLELIAVVLLTGIAIAITNAIGYIFICSNRMWLDLYLRIISGLSIIAFVFFIGRYQGAIGYASAFLFGTIVYFALQLLFLIWLKLLKNILTK